MPPLAYFLQPSSQQIHFGTSVAGRIRLTRRHIPENAPQRPHKLFVSISLKDFDQESPLRFQPLPREFQPKFREMHYTRLVRNRYTRNIGGHIRKNKARFATTEHIFEPAQYLFVPEVTLEELDTVQGLHFEKIERDDTAVPSQTLGGYLGPTARGRAEVNNDLPWADQMVPIIDFHQFESRPRPVSFCPRTLYVSVSHVFMQPGFARLGSFHGVKPVECALRKAVLKDPFA